jgi:HAD superfamily hydrolase (TIGR01549 family)
MPKDKEDYGACTLKNYLSISNLSETLWLFFDVGETLVSESVFHSQRNDALYFLLRRERATLTREEYEHGRRLAILSRPGGESSRVRAIIRAILGSKNEPRNLALAREYYETKGNSLIEEFEKDPNSIFQPYPEVFRVLSYLRSRHHRLGIIANQHRRVRKHLVDSWHFDRYFEHMLLSDEVGYSKPDPEIFLLALDKAGVLPSEACMIGDRVDNDIAPAKELGMKTIRVLHDSEMSIISPLSEEEKPDYQFRDLLPLTNLF